MVGWIAMLIPYAPAHAMRSYTDYLSYIFCVFFSNIFVVRFVFVGPYLSAGSEARQKFCSRVNRAYEHPGNRVSRVILRPTQAPRLGLHSNARPSAHTGIQHLDSI